MCECNFPIAAEKKRQHASLNLASYNRWRNMVNRCHNPADKDFKDYGARGIRVCEQWISDFSEYYKAVGDPPEGKTLDRRDNDKGYCPHNVQWATKSEQNKNRRAPKKTSRLPLGIAYKESSELYMAQIRVHGILYYLGSSKDLSEAVELFRAFYFEWFGKNP